MTDQPSVKQKMQTEALDFRSPLSEALMKTMGGSMNYILDKDDAQDASIASILSRISHAVGITQTVINQYDIGGVNFSIGPNEFMIGIIWNTDSGNPLYETSPSVNWLSIADLSASTMLNPAGYPMRSFILGFNGSFHVRSVNYFTDIYIYGFKYTFAAV